MNAITKAMDGIVFAYIRRCLAHFQKLGDVHDQFADSIAALLSAEIERRNKLMAGWDAECKERRRAAAIKDFQIQSLEPTERLHYLQ